MIRRRSYRKENSSLVYPINSVTPATSAGAITFSNWTRNSMTVTVASLGGGNKILLIGRTGSLKLANTNSYTVTPKCGDIYYNATYGYWQIIEVVVGSYIRVRRIEGYATSSDPTTTTTWTKIIGDGDSSITTTTVTSTTSEALTYLPAVLPEDGVNYTGSATLNSGDRIGDAAVVSFGTALSFNVTGLLRNTMYVFLAYTFNDSASTSPKYKLTAPSVNARKTSN